MKDFDDLLVWFSAELALAEVAAKEAADATDGGTWTVAEEAYCGCCWNIRTPGDALVDTPDSRYAGHIARFDPESVLRMVKSHRAIISQYRSALAAYREDFDGLSALEARRRSTVLSIYVIVLREIARGWGWEEEG